jgi:hypothetical protein
VTRSVAASIAILCLRGLAQQPACTIQGTVVDAASNQPVARARVIAEVRGSHSFLKLTDDRGRFCFDRLTPAAYHLVVQKAGYWEQRHGVTLAVRENSEVKPVTIRMTAYAGISGVVLDADGDPLPGAEVTVWKRTRDKDGWSPDSEDSVEADGQGAFHLSQLAAGTYYVSVKRPDSNDRRFTFPFVDSRGQAPREKEVETFYPGSFTFAGAAPVELKAGQQVENLVLTLKRTRLHRISGRIANPSPSSFLTLHRETETGSSSIGSIPVGKDGSFSREDLLPAQYTLRLSEGQRMVARKDVDLTSGDAVGITLDPLETVDVPVVFRTEGKGPVFRPRMEGWGFLVQDGFDEEVVGRVEDDGTYRFEQVPRGVYRLFIRLDGQRLYVKRIASGGESLPNKKLDLRGAAPGTIEVTLSPNLAELQGRAATPKDHADTDRSEAVTVILVDVEKGGEEMSIASQTGIDQNGNFQMGTVVPGKYRLYAIEGFDEDEWGSAELAKALSRKSVELELKESENKQVDITVISSGEWAAAVKKSGG